MSAYTTLGGDVYVEVGSKRVFAVAVDWPGWARSAKTADAALEALEAYRERYQPVADRAGCRLLPMPMTPRR